MEKPASGDMIVQVEGKNKYAGVIGQFKGKRAVRVKRTLQPGERVV
jgi:flagellar motor switch protein FliM